MKPFIPIYPGILDYLLRGDINRSEFGVYVMMHAQADFSTGVWYGSAPRIAGCAPRGADLRAIQREMQRLADIGLVKHFHRHGARGNFGWLINKYICRSGALRGKQLNARLSTSLSHIVYETCADSDAESVAVSAPYQEVRVKKEEKPRAAKPAADPRFGPFLEIAKTSFEAKHKHPSTWDCFGKDGAALAAFLRRAPHVTAETWQVHILHFFDSTEPFTVKQGGSLSYFVSRFDTFESGPILEGRSNGNRSNAAIKPEAGKYANVKPIRAIG
jgi:hypothetical protein